MDLREKIAEVLYGEYPQVDHACFYGCQNPEHHLKSRVVDAVMGVVEEDAAKRRAYTERRVELARKAEAAIWETRVRELEDENQQMRVLVDDLTDAGTCWYDHHGYCQEHGWFSTDPTCPHARAKDALSRAREIAEEEA